MLAGTAGDYFIGGDRLRISLQVPRVGFISLPLQPAKGGWVMTGTIERPTLSPSILAEWPPAGNWHGYLRDGVLEEC